MSFVSSQKLLHHAWRNRYCLPGFDVFNLELLSGVLRACEKQQSPVIIQTSFINFDFYEQKLLSSMLINILKESTLPILLHLDHGPRDMPMEIIESVLKTGFPSVMADGSHLPLEENIKIMKKVVSLARPYGAAVEGELGQVSRDPSISREEVKKMMTDPREAVRFIEESHIDSLAVSVGSITACFDSSIIEIDFARLEKIAELVSVPLVFHGGTGVPDDAMKKAIALGVAKCNVAHGLRKIFSDVLRGELNGTQGYIDPRPILHSAICDIADYVEKKLELFNAQGKAQMFWQEHPEEKH